MAVFINNQCLYSIIFVYHWLHGVFLIIYLTISTSVLEVPMVAKKRQACGLHFLYGTLDIRRNSMAKYDALTLRQIQNGRDVTDDISKRILLNENVWIFIRFSPNFVSDGLTNNIPTLVHIIAWCRPGDRSLSEPMMVSLLMSWPVSWPGRR